MWINTLTLFSSWIDLRFVLVQALLNRSKPVEVVAVSLANPKVTFCLLSPVRFFATFFAFWVLRRLHDEQWMDYLQPFPWGNEPFLAFVCGLPVGVAVWFLTADGMPTWLRNFYVLPSFVAAVLCAPRHPLRLRCRSD